MFFSELWKTPFHKLPAFRMVHFMLLLPKQEGTFITAILHYFPFLFFQSKFFFKLLGLWDLSSDQGLNQAMRVLSANQWTAREFSLSLFSCQRLPMDTASLPSKTKTL